MVFPTASPISSILSIAICKEVHNLPSGSIGHSVIYKLYFIRISGHIPTPITVIEIVIPYIFLIPITIRQLFS